MSWYTVLVCQWSCLFVLPSCLNPTNAKTFFPHTFRYQVDLYGHVDLYGPVDLYDPLTTVWPRWFVWPRWLQYGQYSVSFITHTTTNNYTNFFLKTSTFLLFIFLLWSLWFLFCCCLDLWIVSQRDRGLSSIAYTRQVDSYEMKT